VVSAASRRFPDAPQVRVERLVPPEDAVEPCAGLHCVLSDCDAAQRVGAKAGQSIVTKFSLWMFLSRYERVCHEMRYGA
jgi:hypothetical protein